jgi:hypothetical protein
MARDDNAPVRIHANRAMAFELAFAGGLFLAIAFLFLRSSPITSGQIWTFAAADDLCAGAGILLIFGLMVLLGLYWMLTPSAMVHLDDAGMTQG